MGETISDERLNELRKGISAGLDRILELQRRMAEKLDRWAEESRTRREKLEAMLYEEDPKKREELLMAFLWRGELPGGDRNREETSLS